MTHWSQDGHEATLKTLGLDTVSNTSGSGVTASPGKNLQRPSAKHDFLEC
jgi:hypothetical protein